METKDGFNKLAEKKRVHYFGFAAIALHIAGATSLPGKEISSAV